MLATEDLAPGDQLTRGVGLGSFDLRRIRSLDDPFFPEAYDCLEDEFGRGFSIETEETLGRRFNTRFREELDGYGLRYEMMLVRSEGAFAGVADYSAIVRNGGCIAHLSHILVAPAFRRTGLAGWLRAMPLLAARECLLLEEYPADSPITIVAEMEHTSRVSYPALSSFEKAGFLKVDTATVHYYQPDFRDPFEIDSTGTNLPIPFALVIRRVGREEQTQISGRELRELVRSLYFMYAATMRPQDIQPCWQILEKFPPDDAMIELVSPTTANVTLDFEESPSDF